jgi:hypothetical protein
MEHFTLGCAVSGGGSYLGMVFWLLSEIPKDMPECAVLGGIAISAILTAGVLWRRRYVQRSRIVLAPDIWPEKPPTPCSEEERRADFLAMAENLITIDEWQERRRARPSPPRVRKECVDTVSLFREVMTDPKYAAGGVKALEIPVPEAPAFKPGDVVRVIYSLSYLYGRLAKLVDGEGMVWWVEFGGEKFTIREQDFVIALPRKGEVWMKRVCAACDAAWDHSWTVGLHTVHSDWLDSLKTRQHISCGCFYRLGSQDKKS